jgi:hypothetical protein
MARVDPEAVPPASGAGQAGEHLGRCLKRRAAAFAYEMAVGGRGKVIARWTVAEVCVNDDTETFQLVKVPIDGRDMNVRHPPMDHLGEVLSRSVAFRVEECLEEVAAGCRDAAPTGSHQVEDLLHPP